MRLSVIVPAYNEADSISKTIEEIRSSCIDTDPEIIIVDGGSTDGTRQKAKQLNLTLLQSPRKGRAAQMNFGAKQAHGDILYFLHADTLPPVGFDQTIIQAIESEYNAGCFQLSFDDPHYLLQCFAWFTRFDIDAFRFGDQSLFITKEVFEKLDGFNEDHIVMEDQEMVRRIKQSHSFAVLDDRVTTSARKYRRHGVLKLQLIFTLIFILYYLGVDQHKLVRVYKKLLGSQ